MGKRWFKTPEEAQAYLLRGGYSWDADYERYQRQSWYAYIRKGRCGFWIEAL
jgi:hypothetical protein